MDCWVYDRWKPNAYGYVRVKVAGQSHTLHRIVWESRHGCVPSGFELDHLCRNRACCNPHHLEPVTRSQNQRRGLKGALRSNFCKRGHEFTPDNTYLFRGRRNCRACHRDINREFARSQTEAIAAARTTPKES